MTQNVLSSLSATIRPAPRPHDTATTATPTDAAPSPTEPAPPREEGAV
ncbi:hypothetical protein [Streptomyces sp. NPDC001137]